LELSKHFIAGLGLGLLLAACAGASFPYHYYGIDLSDSLLKGPTTQDDLSLSATCMPTSGDASPCTGILTSEFLALKQDYINTKNELNSCQQKLVAYESKVN
jgi:hypothetical protein